MQKHYNTILIMNALYVFLLFRNSRLPNYFHFIDIASRYVKGTQMVVFNLTG